LNSSYWSGVILLTTFRSRIVVHRAYMAVGSVLR
jgi:hypothetical protein